MTWLQTKIRRLPPDPSGRCWPVFPAIAVKQLVIGTWLRQLPQRLLQFSQSVDFRYSTLQRSHRGGDVFEKMLMTFDKAEKSVST